jgi:hypothetical protein
MSFVVGLLGYQPSLLRVQYEVLGVESRDSLPIIRADWLADHRPCWQKVTT